MQPGERCSARRSAPARDRKVQRTVCYAVREGTSPVASISAPPRPSARARQHREAWECLPPLGSAVGKRKNITPRVPRPESDSGGADAAFRTVSPSSGLPGSTLPRDPDSGLQRFSSDEFVNRPKRPELRRLAWPDSASARSAMAARPPRSGVYPDPGSLRHRHQPSRRSSSASRTMSRAK